MDKLRKVVSSIVALSLSVGMLPATLSAMAEESSFDPETVMWTDNKIENVLAEAGIYENAMTVNPNASSKTNTTVQNPYGKIGEVLTDWAYSEFVWTNSYPIGNGRMAGMIAGGIDKEVIQLNEDTCWDGSPYGTLKDENGNTLTTIKQTNVAQTITATDMTSGSFEGGWKYFRGADENGNPAPIGSADTIVGDETFRSTYPDFANKSISNQALNIDNAKELEAVQNRWSMERMVEETFLGSPTRQRAYKSFVEVYLDFGHENAKAENY
ncbi:MAG: glycoside hydrolase N-terminal domain-containing protein, partial [Clostridia bacterium]|nr:glycoside hydrolase N-terminal domain-containing protein [Clostridia bacterium]